MAADLAPASESIACSLIIPVYRNEGNIGDLLAALDDLHAKLGQLEVVLVVDGSPDQSAALLDLGLRKAAYAWQLVEFSRNFGSFAAIRHGLSVARGRFFAVMAADLQEPPDLVLGFYRELSAGHADVVVGTRTGRNDPALASISSRIFWALYRRFVMPSVPRGGVDIFGCNLAFRDALLSLEERESFLIGQLFWIGFRRKEMPYVRRERLVGKSAWNLRRKLVYMLDGIFAFSALPVSLLLWIGAIGVLFSSVSIVVVLAAWLGGRINVAGYTPIMLAIMFFGSLTTLGLGTIGGYVWRIAENGRRRPLSIVFSHKMSAAPENDHLPR